MKVVISLKPLQSASKTRGIGVYTRELLKHLQDIYPKDEFIPTTHDYYHQDADIVHFPFFDPFFLTLPLKKTKPTVVTIHDLIPLKFPKHFPKGIRGLVKWGIQKHSVKQVDCIITDSESSKRDIIDILQFPEDKIVVTSLGPNIKYSRIPAKLKQSVKKEYSLPDKYILYVGDINWNKNIVGLIKEFNNTKHKDIHLVLVGNAFTQDDMIPELEEIMNEINNSNKRDKIHRVGFVPSHHLPPLYAMATAYIQPSWYEGFGLTVLEAMEHRCPVISSNQGSLPEVGGSAVLYFDPHNNGELAKQIDKLIDNDSLKKELIDMGKQQAKKFTWRKTAKTTYEVYKKLVLKQ